MPPTAETSEAKRTRTRATLRKGMSFHISWSGKILKAKNLTDKKQRMNFLRKNQGIQTTPNCRRCPSEEDKEKTRKQDTKRVSERPKLRMAFPKVRPAQKTQTPMKQRILECRVTNPLQGDSSVSSKPGVRCTKSRVSIDHAT